MAIEKNPNYIHHADKSFASMFREVVFGMEDGMVSTLGAVTGIASATGNPFTTLLAGFVIVSVESVSMGVGSFLSNKSEKELDDRKVFEERTEIEEFPEEEKEELKEIYLADGWPADLAAKMAETAAGDKKLFLKEMSYHELGVTEENEIKPKKQAAAMFFSYIFGGLIPLLPYVFLNMGTAILVSIVLTLLALFSLGVATSKFTKRKWWKAGLEMFLLASGAMIVGYAMGQLSDRFLSDQSFAKR